MEKLASTHAVVVVDLVVIVFYCLALVVAEIAAVVGLAAGTGRGLTLLSCWRHS